MVKMWYAPNNLVLKFRFCQAVRNQRAEVRFSNTRFLLMEFELFFVGTN